MADLRPSAQPTPVVAYLDREHAARDRDTDARSLRSGMLDDVRKCLRDEEVDAGLDRAREALLTDLQRIDR
jgi:hypothetical protein